MPPKKLSDSDKQEILDRYCHSDETTVTLAAKYGVSTSTVSRILKQSLPEEDYEALVQRKRQGGYRSQPEQELLPGLLATESTAVAELQDEEAEAWETSVTAPQRRQRKRSAAGSISVEQLAASAAQLSQLVSQLDLAPPVKRLDAVLPTLPEIEAPLPLDEHPAVGVFEPVEDDEEEDEEEDEDEEQEDDLDDEDLDDEDLAGLDEDDLEDDYDENGDEGGFADELVNLSSIPMTSTGLVQILPLAEAPIPRTCYVVVDRASELITRPLKEFADLGKLPGNETQDKTLPIFDNHRVAKRFLRRMQRIVKVPDGRVFQKVKPYLQAKGITHLLIDGRVYSLS